jgi:hypothetical protein
MPYHKAPLAGTEMGKSQELNGLQSLFPFLRPQFKTGRMVVREALRLLKQSTIMNGIGSFLEKLSYP